MSGLTILAFVAGINVGLVIVLCTNMYHLGTAFPYRKDGWRKSTGDR